jgi:hypothetical protein
MSRPPEFERRSHRLRLLAVFLVGVAVGIVLLQIFRPG